MKLLPPWCCVSRQGRRSGEGYEQWHTRMSDFPFCEASQQTSRSDETKTRACSSSRGMTHEALVTGEAVRTCPQS